MQVLPVHVLPSSYDIYLNAEWNCKIKLDEEWAAFRLKNDYVNRINEYYAETYKNL
jgi:hypothetical protein